MARIRSIKPEFPEDELLGSVPIQVRYLFIMLWTIADDDGRFRAAPAGIKAKLFPYDEDLKSTEVGDWLQQLHDVGRIFLYTVRNQQYGQINNWLKHQRIDRPSRSLLPGFHEGSTNDHESSTNQHDRSTHIPSGIGEEGKGEDQEGRGVDLCAKVCGDTEYPALGSGNSLSPAAAFHALRDQWPEGRRGSQRRALAEWNRAVDRAAIHMIVKGAQAWVAYWSIGDNAAFAHEFPNWLHDERWAESPPLVPKSKGAVREQEIRNTFESFLSKGETA